MADKKTNDAVGTGQHGQQQPTYPAYLRQAGMNKDVFAPKVNNEPAFDKVGQSQQGPKLQPQRPSSYAVQDWLKSRDDHVPYLASNRGTSSSFVQNSQANGEAWAQLEDFMAANPGATGTAAKSPTERGGWAGDRTW